MTDAIEEVRRLKEEVRKAETDKARMEGQLSQLQKEAQEKFGVKTADALKKLLDEKEKEAQQLSDELENKLAKVKEEYEW